MRLVPLHRCWFYRAVLDRQPSRGKTLSLESRFTPDGRLHVVPTSETFRYIWREALEVHWDADRCSLYGPPPRKWSRADWLRQILVAARYQGCELLITEKTEWSGIEPIVKAEMIEAVRTLGGAWDV